MTDTSRSGDLVKRLRVNDAEIYLPILGQAADRIEELASMEECLTAELGDANDRIEALEAENERLRLRQRLRQRLCQQLARNCRKQDRVGRGVMDEFVEFPMSNDKAAQDRAYWYRQGKDDGIEQERGNIVEWLRSASNGIETVKYGNLFADEIEAGEHLK